MYSKPACPFCDKADFLIKKKRVLNPFLTYEKYMLDVDFSREDLMSKFPEARTFPQITQDDQYIGGYTELEKHLI